MNTPLCLNDIKPGEKARVCCLTSCGSIRRRFLDIGLTENTLVECVGVSPLGDPAAYAIRGAVIAIRKTDSKNILITIFIIRFYRTVDIFRQRGFAQCIQCLFKFIMVPVIKETQGTAA